MVGSVVLMLLFSTKITGLSKVTVSDTAYIHFTECKITKEDKWYNGHHNVTETGHVCQAWISHYPNDHTKEPSTNDPDQFPDASIEDAGNYCRNPDDSKMPWCYIADPDGPPRRYCDIPMCCK